MSNTTNDEQAEYGSICIHGVAVGKHCAYCAANNAPAPTERAPTDMAFAVALMRLISPEQRLEVMSDYCRYCGTDKVPCHCENDD